MTWTLILAFARKNWQAILAAVLIATFIGWGMRGYSKAKALQAELDKQVQATADMQAERDKARTERAAALDAAETCSASVAALKDAADKRHADATPARHQAASTAHRNQQRAAAILAAPPAVPGDDAASARARIDAWISSRER